MSEGTLLECNDSFAHNLGYGSAEQMCNLKMESIYFEREDRMEMVARLLQRGKLNNVELCCRRKDGSAAWLLSNLTVMEPSENDVVFQSISVDITEIKHAQEELRHLSAKVMNSQDEERRKIARGLHDSVGQCLAAVSMALETAKQHANCLPESIFGKLDEAAQATKMCISEIRTISHLLHPALLEELGLGFAIRWYIEGFASRSGIHVTTEMPDEIERLGDDIELVVFRILQECLTNVHWHSGSQTASLKVCRDSLRVLLEVRDQGRGETSVRPLRPGVGITGMRERVRDLHGALEINSDDFGTLVKVVIPLTFCS